MNTVKSEALNLTKKFVSINTYEEAGKYEILEYVMEYLGDSVPEKQIFKRDNAPFLVAHIGEKRDDHFKLILQGHLDVVPPGYMPDAFEPEVTEEKLIGRGSSDMKSGCACALAAFKQASLHELTKGEIYLCYTTDEEFSSQTIKEILKDYLPSADLALVGEPTEAYLGVGSKGNLWVDVEINGVSGHGSTPEVAHNTIDFGRAFLNELYDYCENDLKAKEDKLFGLPTYSIGSFQAGEYPNIIPDYCKIQLDRRYIPGETNEDIVREVQMLLDRTHAKMEGFTSKVKRWVFDWPVYCFPMESKVYGRLVDALAPIENYTPEAKGVAYWGEGGYINEYTPSIYYGPGSIKVAHSSYEFVPLDRLYIVAEGYMRIINELCV